MSKTAKIKEKKFTIQSFIRLVVFFVVVFLLISYFAQKKGDTLGVQVSFPDSSPVVNKITDSAWNSLPPKSRETLSNLDKLPISKFFEDKTNYLKSELNGFPQKQIKEIQKGVINKVAEELVKKVDN